VTSLDFLQLRRRVWFQGKNCFLFNPSWLFLAFHDGRPDCHIPSQFFDFFHGSPSGPSPLSSQEASFTIWKLAFKSSNVRDKSGSHGFRVECRMVRCRLWQKFYFVENFLASLRGSPPPVSSCCMTPTERVLSPGRAALFLKVFSGSCRLQVSFCHADLLAQVTPNDQNSLGLRVQSLS